MNTWIEDNEEELRMLWAENGVDRELDFDLEREEEKAWNTIGKLQVMRSPAGYYIGRRCPIGTPYCRESTYYKTREEAEQTLNGV